MASSINRRRAFNQIQNTISKSKSTTSRIGENNIVGKEDIVGRLNLDDENASVVMKNQEKRKDILLEEEPIRDFGKPIEIFEEKKTEENVGGLDIATGGGDVDLDDSVDSIETHSMHIDCPPIDYDYDDIIGPPHERVSHIDPRFWNRFLMPSSSSLSPPEFDNKENILLHLFDDEDDDAGTEEWEEMERALASLGLQKLTLFRNK